MEGESACEVVSSNRELGLECIDIDGELIRDDMVRVRCPQLQQFAAKRAVEIIWEEFR